MKLPGWMNRKFRQNNSDPLKDFSIGHVCNCLIGQIPLDEQQQYHHMKQNCGNRQFRPDRSPEDHYYEDDQSSAAMSELFHGFLTIGTLGSDPINTDPATPTFAFSIEDIAEKETQVTEDELKLINNELEKVLAAEAREDGYTDSSGRNSYVSTGRSSYGSTITLSGKAFENQEKNENGTTVCPLQEFLFGSAIELSETAALAKKESRTSLGELFQKSKSGEENYSGGKFDREDKHSEKEAAEKSIAHLLKRILKKKLLHGSSKNSTGPGGDSTSTDTKVVHKILQMFYRKVHPERPRKTGKPPGNESRKSSSSTIAVDEDIILIPHRGPLEHVVGTRRHESRSNVPHFDIGGSCDGDGSRECWIRTDADYLVLEL